MAKESSPKININLSSKNKKTVGKVFYQWSINAGRAIIVLIELVALGALGYRFYIDRQIVDLHDQIKLEENKIIAQASNEKLYRDIQERLNQITKIDKDTKLKMSILDVVNKTITEGTLFDTKFTINDKTASIDGTTFSITTLTNFIQTLKNTPTVTEISVSEINTSAAGVDFKLNFKIEEESKSWFKRRVNLVRLMT